MVVVFGRGGRLGLEIRRGSQGGVSHTRRFRRKPREGDPPWRQGLVKDSERKRKREEERDEAWRELRAASSRLARAERA